MVLRLFVQSLEGEARKWFKSLANNIVHTWEEMENFFTLKWGEKRDHGYVLTKFNALKKRQNEDVTYFIKRFNKFYNNIPTEIKPPQAAAKVVFTGAFEPDFGFTLRERSSTSLDQIQTDALHIEAKFASTGKFKGKTEHEARRKKGEESSILNKERELQEHIIEEMNKLIKNLSNKLVKLESEAKKSPPCSNQMIPNWGFNPQYWRPPLQLLQQAEEVTENQEDQFLAYYDDEQGEPFL